MKSAICAVLIVALLVPGFLHGEEQEKVIVVSERVGEEIDEEEAKRFGLFGSYEGFVKAVYLQLADGSYVVDIYYKEEGEEKKTRLSQSAQSLESLRGYIENYEEVAPKILVEDAVAQAKKDASADVNGCIWFGAGFACSVIGIGVSRSMIPSPKPERLIGKSPDYIEAYTTTYKEACKTNQNSIATAGCVVGAMMALIISSSAATAMVHLEY